jgi:hypothetical protein
MSASGAAGPAVAGVPVVFLLFAATLAGVLVAHRYALPVALAGLALIAVVRVGFSPFDAAAHARDEWPKLANLFGLLVGFAVLADDFDSSHVGERLPAILPRGVAGCFALLLLVWLLSGLLDNIAAAMIGASLAARLFAGKVTVGYLVAIVAAANAGGAGSVLGDTTTTMIWLDGVSPLRVIAAYVGSAAALLVLTVLGLSAGMALVGRERARAQAAYEQELRARQMETEARAKEAEARERAEKNFRQAQQLVDYIAETAAADGAAEGELVNLRRKLLLAALSYYKDFIEQQNDDQLTHEELLRGYTRVATLLDATGRRDDARVAWNEAFRIAMRFQDDEAPFRLAPARNTLRLLKQAQVRETLGLTPEQGRAVLALVTKEHEPAEAARKEIASLLTPEQAARLNQLLVQQAGIWAFVDPAVSESIQLTPAQRAALAATQKAARAGQRAPGEKDDGASLDRITWVFTADQRARWRELVGEPFAGALPPPELTLASGNFTIRLTPARPAPDQKKGPGDGPPASGGTP